MKIQLTNNNKFTFVLDHKYDGTYRVVIRLNNISGFPIVDFNKQFTYDLSSWWMVPPGCFYNDKFSFLVEVYQLNNLICRELFEKTEEVGYESFISIGDNKYDIFHLDTMEDISLTPENSICFTELMQYYAYREIFFDECYWKDSYSDIYKNSTVLDIGSNIGMFALFATEKGSSKIYSFEPVRDNFTLTSHNTKDYRDIIFPINAGVSDKDGWKKITVDWMGMAANNNSTAFKFGIKGLDVNKSDEYRTEFWTSNSIFDRLDLKDVDIVKLDCEGGEFDFFEYISDDKLSKIKLILCEWHVQSEYWDRYNSLHSKILNLGFSVNYPKENYEQKSLQNKDESIFVCFYENKELGVINNNIENYKEDDYDILTSFGKEY
tara:strand:+ start:1247 stop:2380 length:1134 start_codon:yes stop_codon:yes gene_type:complete